MSTTNAEANDAGITRGAGNGRASGSCNGAAPRVTAIIPARGGSQGIPMKNLQRVGGQSLLARAVLAAQATPLVTDVVVSTDHPRIRQEAERFGAVVIDRPEELAGCVASSESALLHALNNITPRRRHIR